ncbi:MAG: XdhC family protein [Methanobacteriaceae archaeon]|jgi:xanthine dehydrogenase accessory factor|nr:XdhC family protein [Methanobacteriaceae archaeon]
MKTTIYDVIRDYIANGKTGTIATIVSKDGSSPRNTGAKMFVGEDEKVYETIGGGGLEYKVQKHAIKSIGNDEPQLMEIRLDSEEVGSDGDICGGVVEVFLEPVLEKHAEVYQRIDHLEKNGEKGIFITSFNGKYQKTLLEEDMSITGDSIRLDDNSFFQSNINQLQPRLMDETLIETIHPSPILYLFGAGHVSQFISPLADTVGFQVVVIDDREEFANKKRFPNANKLIIKDFKDVFNQLNFTGEEYVVIVTRGHQFDKDVLEESLKKETKYLGMIGSRTKVKMILEYMKECGYDEEKVDGVHSPIGLSISAETPQEIAVSIVAEMIQVRREKSE